MTLAVGQSSSMYTEPEIVPSKFSGKPVYTTHHEHDPTSTQNLNQKIQLTHTIILHSYEGKPIKVKALFDGGAMIGAICTSIYQKIGKQLGNWKPSTRILQMANGAQAQSQATWSGKIELGRRVEEGSFEVFESGNGWEFLFGKPLLWLFQISQNFATDEITLPATEDSPPIVLKNEGNQTQQPKPPDMNKQEEWTQEMIININNPPHDPIMTPINVVQDDTSIFTRQSNPFKQEHVRTILQQVQIGMDITEEQ